MEQKEIEEGNILIAEFMGEKFKAYKDNHSYNREFATYADCAQYIKEGKLEDGYVPELGWKMGVGKYNTSWNWLMPVVEKIAKTRGHVIGITYCDDCNVQINFYGESNKADINVTSSNHIEAVWLAVVEFIKHHNSKTKSDEKES